MNVAGEKNEGARLLAKVLEDANQKEVGRRCGVSQSLVSTWRSGRTKPLYENRKIIAVRYGIPIDAWDQPAKKDAA